MQEIKKKNLVKVAVLDLELRVFMGGRAESPGTHLEMTDFLKCYPEQGRRENKAALEEGRLSLGKSGTCLFDTAPNSYHSAGC